MKRTSQNKSYYLIVPPKKRKTSLQRDRPYTIYCCYIYLIHFKFFIAQCTLHKFAQSDDGKILCGIFFSCYNLMSRLFLNSQFNVFLSPHLVVNCFGLDIKNNL